MGVDNRGTLVFWYPQSEDAVFFTHRLTSAPAQNSWHLINDFPQSYVATRQTTSFTKRTYSKQVCAESGGTPISGDASYCSSLFMPVYVMLVALSGKLTNTAEPNDATGTFVYIVVAVSNACLCVVFNRKYMALL